MKKITVNKDIVSGILKHPEAYISSFDLVYIDDFNISIQRVKRGENFSYLLDRQEVTNQKVLKRINDLAIPPNWINTRISKLSNGHLQAVGRDAKGRKQYLYHPKWNLIRNQAKFFKMISFGNALPKIRKKVEEDLSQNKWTLTKVLALIIKVL